MKAEKDIKTGKWLIQYRYTDWQGERRKSTKRGFKTKREAEAWLCNFMLAKDGDLSMTFEEFLTIYYADMETRLREHTMRTKKYIIDLKIMPHFKMKRMNEIKATNVRAWQNELIRQGNSPTYLRTIHSQLSAVFNCAVKYYDLRNNPCTKAGIMDKQAAYTAFMVLYWTGIRIGKLLALTPAGIDFEKKTLSIIKSYQRLNGKDVITTPKTHKSIRTLILM